MLSEGLHWSQRVVEVRRAATCAWLRGSNWDWSQQCAEDRVLETFRYGA